LETCPSGQLLEIGGTDQRATRGGACRSDAGALPVLDTYRLDDRGVEQTARCPGVVDQGRRPQALAMAPANPGRRAAVGTGPTVAAGKPGAARALPVMSASRRASEGSSLRPAPGWLVGVRFPHQGEEILMASAAPAVRQDPIGPGGAGSNDPRYKWIALSNTTSAS
jgi:hypothetical protein